MFFDKLRKRQQLFLARADLILNVSLLTLSVLLIWRQSQDAVGEIWRDPLMLFLSVLVVLTLGETIVLIRTRRRWLAASVLPVMALILTLMAVWHKDPTAHMWVIAAMVLPFTRFPWKIAAAICLIALTTSLWILQTNWHVDQQFMIRSVLSGAMLIAVMSIFAWGWGEVRLELGRATQMMEETLQNVTQGVALFDAEGRLRLFNTPLAEQLQLPAC